MLFHTYGSKDNPMIIMLGGSFCAAFSMKNLYEELQESFYILAPDYNGHYKNSRDFTSREEEADEIIQYLMQQQIGKIPMVYGQSMGAEIGMELIAQAMKKGIQVEKAFFDGGPFIKLSLAMKGLMYLKFKSLINMIRKKPMKEIMENRFLKHFLHGDVESVRPMLESMVQVVPNLSDRSILTECECCYTFDFPTMNKEMQENLYFFYAAEEKAYKTCYKKVKQAYPYAKYKVVKGYSHLTYQARHTKEYVGVLKKIMSCKGE